MMLSHRELHVRLEHHAVLERLPVHEVEEVVVPAQRLPGSDRFGKHFDVIVSAELVEKRRLP